MALCRHCGLADLMAIDLQFGQSLARQAQNPGVAKVLRVDQLKQLAVLHLTQHFKPQIVVATGVDGLPASLR